MTPRILNLRKKLHEKLRLSAVEQDILDLIREIEKETDDLLARAILSR